MLRYTIQRILTFIPMLIAISLLSFVISINAPGDPVERLAKSAESEGSAQEQSGASKKIKAELRKKLGLDLPIFYLSIADLSNIDFSQVGETDENTIRKSLDETQFVLKWNTEPTFITDGTVVPLQTLTHDQALTLMATSEWSEPIPVE